MKLLKYKKLEGKIELLSGLHIGGDKDKIEIGGIDSPVIRNPKTGLPYIPGSSLKGKMRFLLEWKLGKVMNDGPCSCGTCEVCTIFGHAHTNKNVKNGPTRIVVSDCNIILNNGEKEKWDTGDLKLFEDKVENRINRLTGTAIDPRHIERVVSGTVFDFNLTYKVFELSEKENKEQENKDEKNWSNVVDALYFIQEDAIGGSGSRGYGKIKFKDLKFDGVSKDLIWNGTNATLEDLPNA